MLNNITPKMRVAALKAFLRKQTFESVNYRISSNALPYFLVEEIDADGQTEDSVNLIVITVLESGTVKHTFTRDLTDADCFMHKGENWVIVPSNT